MRLRGLIGRCCSAMLAAAALAFGIGQTGLPSAEVVAAQSKSMREPRVAGAAEHDDYGCAVGGRRRIRAAGGAGRGAGPAFSDLPAFCRVEGDVETVRRLRYQDRSLVAGIRLERQVRGGRQRRLERQHRPERAGGRPAPRLCDRQHGYRPRRRRRPLDAESGEARRLRIPRRPRDDRRPARPSSTAHYGNGAEALILRRLLGRRPAGAEGGATLPRRLRRHRRRRARR